MMTRRVQEQKVHKLCSIVDDDGDRIKVMTATQDHTHTYTVGAIHHKAVWVGCGLLTYGSDTYR